MEEDAASDGVPGHEVGASPALGSPWHGGITEGGAASDGVPGHERDERGGAAAGLPKRARIARAFLLSPWDGGGIMEEDAASDGVPGHEVGASPGVPGHEVGASPGVPGHAVSIEKRGASAGGPRLARMRGVSLRSPWHGGITEGGAASDGVPGHERDERGGPADGVPRRARIAAAFLLSPWDGG